MAHSYGWLPDVPDQRDYRFSALRPGFARVLEALPPSVDLRGGCSPVEDQGALGSCTANALVGGLEYLELKDKVPFADMSRLFVYYNERRLEGSTKWDSGAYLRDGMKTLAADGTSTEPTWPYKVRKYRCKPSRRAYAEGLNHQITEYMRLDTLAEMKTCLADGFPFVFGFTVYESFETAVVASTGIVPMPGPNERVLGGHAVLAVGYDDALERFFVRNSWGPAWGMKGYFTMPYGYLTDRNLSDDLWTIRRGELM